MKLNKTLKNIFCLGAIPLCIVPIVSCSCNSSKPTPPDPWPDPAHYSFNATSTAKDVYDYQISPKKTYYFDISYEIMIDHEDFTKKTGADLELTIEPEHQGAYELYIYNYYLLEEVISLAYDITCLSKTETVDTYKLHIHDTENNIEKKWSEYYVYKYDSWYINYYLYFSGVSERLLPWTYSVKVDNRGSVNIYK